jgi:hypothetical protein
VADTGDKQKFQKVQEAYERLKAGQDGYTLSEDDLYDMYQQQRRGERGRHSSSSYEQSKQEWYDKQEEYD